MIRIPEYADRRAAEVATGEPDMSDGGPRLDAIDGPGPDAIDGPGPDA